MEVFSDELVLWECDADGLRCVFLILDSGRYAVQVLRDGTAIHTVRCHGDDDAAHLAALLRDRYTDPYYA